MDKDVYNGQLIPIDDIPEDGASIAELSTTPPVATHMTNGVQEDEDDGNDDNEVHKGMITTKVPKKF